MKGGKRRRDSHNQSAQQDEPVETEKQNEHLGKWGIGMEWQREREEEGVKAGSQSVSHSLNSSSASFNPKVDIGIIVFLAKGNREIRTRLLLLQ